MPRKKREQTEAASTQPASIETNTIAAGTFTAEEPPVERPAWVDGPPVHTATADLPDAAREEPPKNWGDPYKSIFSCGEQGFELGENRRFKQRVFMFREKPTGEILSALKNNGFTYRAAEKAWTLPANPETPQADRRPG